MDSGWAALIGTAAGFVATLIASVGVPFWLRKKEKADRLAEARDEALRRLVPAIIREAGVMANSAASTSVTEAMAIVAELDSWLEPDEWPISRLAILGAYGHPDTELSAARRIVPMQQVLTGWARGDLTANGAKELFEKRTGLTVTPWSTKEIGPDV